MVDRRWVPLGIRIVGLYIAGMGMPGLLRSLGDIARWIEYNRNSEVMSNLWLYVAIAAGSLIQISLGVLLIIKATALARRWVGDLSKKCPACLADLGNAASEECPECGGAIARSANQSQ